MKNLIIYKYNSLYDILKEIDFDFNFKTEFVNDECSLNNQLKTYKNSLILSNTKYFGTNNFLVLHDLPLNIFKLIEVINAEFLKLQYRNQSNVKLGEYTIDLNSREISTKINKVKLTEKEIETIVYLSKINRPVGIDELQNKVWSYQNEIETHTVETHIYRLRKKILDIFNDNKFIVSKKNGYQIK